MVEWRGCCLWKRGDSKVLRHVLGDPWDKLGPGDPVALLEWMVGSVGSDEVTLLGSSCAVLGGGLLPHVMALSPLSLG